MKPNELTKPALVCKLTSPELQHRKKITIIEIKTLLLHKVETEDGFRYKFNGTDAVIDFLTNFVKTERLCCDFFNYELSIRDANSFLWLALSGPEGGKDFINTELDF